MEGGQITMNEQDWRAVETMVLSGLDLEALYTIFPAFDREALKRVYDSVKGTPVAVTAGNEIKCNCS